MSIEQIDKEILLGIIVLIIVLTVGCSVSIVFYLYDNIVDLLKRKHPKVWEETGKLERWHEEFLQNLSEIDSIGSRGKKGIFGMILAIYREIFPITKMIHFLPEMKRLLKNKETGILIKAIAVKWIFILNIVFLVIMVSYFFVVIW